MVYHKLRFSKSYSALKVFITFEMLSPKAVNGFYVMDQHKVVAQN